MITNHNEGFVLLDDCAAHPADPRSRCYTRFRASLSCRRVQDFPGVLAQTETALRAGLYAVALFSYELGAQLHGLDHAPSDWPLAEVLLFESCESLSAEQVHRWLAEKTAAETSPSGVANLATSVSYADFASALAAIRAYIEAGDTYQVNYTFRWRFDSFGAPAALYQRLRERQAVPYGALIALPDGRSVISMSPELFLTHLKGLLTARPMKGTAAASGNEALDAERAQVLAGDVKNRAENLMIVDLLRNDLGRIARLGSVQVPALYDVARHGDVLQMTSTVQATLRPDVKLIDLFRAVYPCGSITGAPKRRTMEIIHEVEPDARGLYTGAIGWFDPPETAGTVGDFCMSVPIRTLVLAAADESGIRKGELGVGAGIVFDSVASEEYAECALKAQFLTRLPQAFQLVETMRLTQKSCPLLERHCQRMRQSAAYFGLAFEEDAFYQAVREACADAGEGEYSMRVLLGSTGMTVHTATLAPFAQPVRLLRAPATTHSNDLFLRHKTTVRATYDAAWRAAEAQGAFDMLFCNERGDLTEGARSTLLVKLDERWFTPPLSAGVLPGVMRSTLMDDPQWRLQERELTWGDLQHADDLAVCNALRGVMRAVLD